MKPTFRATTAADLEDVTQFLARAFNVSLDSAFLQPAVMRWKYWEPRHDWSEPRSYVLELQGQIVAHGGIWPVIIGSGPAASRGCQVIDWAAAKDAPGAGASIMRKIAATLDFIQAIGGAEVTRRVLPASGFVECAQVWRGARPLRPVRQIFSHQNRNWKLAPRLVRNWLWAESPKNNIPAGWSVEQISPEQIPDGEAFRTANESVFSLRTREFLEFYLRCPIGRLSLHQVRNSIGPQGHFVVLVLRGQARIAGVWLREPNPETWRATFLLAQKAALESTDANEIIAAGTEGISSEAAGNVGFRVVGRAPVYMLNSSGRLALTPGHQFQLWDDDEAFLDSGDAAYLT